ncbi:MAG: ArsB/NhaD family transporter [Deltaproteobacteria bacterium]|nr:ArsB/NhaD family transporter [Deltaproteobacteria bacterium]MBZ0219454.1 ArsB/NhaD family transporter [Deltaproteobacteria bacterium]
MEFDFFLAIAIFALVYALLIWDKINRAVVALLGASALIVLGVINQEAAVEGIDFNTIGLLIGMMIIVFISQKTGMFQYIAIKGAKISKGDPWRILISLSIVTAVLSALLDNVTTVLLTVPITLLITEELEVSPYPFLVSQILMSNIGGTATLIGDPPNIMIGSAVGLTFMDFVFGVGPVIPIIAIATLIPLKVIYGKSFRVSDERKKRIMEFREAEALTDRSLMIKCLAVLGLVIGGFILQRHLHLEPATIALFGAAILLLISKEDLHGVMEKVEWTSIFFFIGLFIVVHGLIEVGFIRLMADMMLEATGGHLVTTGFVILWGSAIASSIVDNIPFVATMIPLIKGMAPSFGGDSAVLPLWWSLSLGACLGGNGTIIGASANVVVAGIAHRNGHAIGFFKFMLLAYPLMLFSIAIATVYMYIRYLG